MADEKAVLMYKGRPLMRKDNLMWGGRRLVKIQPVGRKAESF